MSRSLKVVLIAALLGNLTIVWVGYKAYQYRSYINYWLDKYTFVVDEFSGRKVYEAENASLRSDTTVPGRVVFLGTQVISRWDTRGSFPSWEAINRGIEGQRLAGYLLRFRSDVVALGPEAVVIEVSSYNFRPQWPVIELEDYVASMADLARANGIAPIIGTVIPPWKDVVDLGDYRIMDSIRTFNDWLREGEGHGKWRLVDFGGLLSDEQGYLRRDLSTEAIDPNEAGYRAMTQGLDRILGGLRAKRAG